MIKLRSENTTKTDRKNLKGLRNLEKKIQDNEVFAQYAFPVRFSCTDLAYALVLAAPFHIPFECLPLAGISNFIKSLSLVELL